MIRLIKPEFKELSFRQKLIGDAETMAYNKKWGGAIAFPPEKWSQWYEWLGRSAGQTLLPLHLFPEVRSVCRRGRFPL